MVALNNCQHIFRVRVDGNFRVQRQSFFAFELAFFHIARVPRRSKPPNTVNQAALRIQRLLSEQEKKSLFEPNLGEDSFQISSKMNVQTPEEHTLYEVRFSVVPTNNLVRDISWGDWRGNYQSHQRRRRNLISSLLSSSFIIIFINNIINKK